MRLVVKQSDRTVKEFQFTDGPIHIGRQSSNHISLPDRMVSKQHAKIFTDDGEWLIEDLGSANKTYLNDEAIQKAEIKNGDSIRIADFTIEVDIESGLDDAGPDESAELGDTLTATATGPQIIIRKPGAESAPRIRFPAERAVDFLQATQAIARADSVDKVLLVLLNILKKQFDANQFWCALRGQAGGPMACHAGRQRGGSEIQMDELKHDEKITEAIEKNQFMLFLFSKIPGQDQKDHVRSVLIGPLLSPAGCFGVLYVNNTFRDDHYSLDDLDYLMMLAIHTATVLENL